MNTGVSDRVAHLNVYDLSKCWRVDPKTLNHWRQRGAGPIFLKIGRRIMYRKEDVEAFEEANLRQITNKHMGKPIKG